MRLSDVRRKVIKNLKEKRIQQILALKPDAIAAGYEYPEYHAGTEKALRDYTLEDLEDFRVDLIDHLVDTNYYYGGV